MMAEPTLPCPTSVPFGPSYNGRMPRQNPVFTTMLSMITRIFMSHQKNMSWPGESPSNCSGAYVVKAGYEIVAEIVYRHIAQAESRSAVIP